jgi:hypothetical protein
MKFAATITRNRITSTLRWIGLAALERPSIEVPPLAETLGRFERAARRVSGRQSARKAAKL